MAKQIRLGDLSGLRRLLPEQPAGAAPRNTAAPVAGGSHDGKGGTLSVTLDAKGRKGRVVTVISGFQHNPETMDKIARMLKQLLGAGGTVRGMSIEIQGDQRERVAKRLRDWNYVVR